VCLVLSVTVIVYFQFNDTSAATYGEEDEIELPNVTEPPEELEPLVTTTPPVTTTAPFTFPSQGITPGVRGNTAGNLANDGFIAIQGDWIYYSFSFLGDIYGRQGFYRVRTDGTGKEKLNDAICSNINIVGDWIYFTRWYSFNPGSYIAGFYRMRTDGTEMGIFIEGVIGDFIIVDDWIYYSHYDGTYKIRLDGSENTRLLDRWVLSMDVWDDWIYFNNIGDLSIFKMRTDGSEITRLPNTELTHKIIIVGDWIFYEKRTQDQSKGWIYRIRTDGTDNTKVTDFYISTFNISGGWIYFYGVDWDYNNGNPSQGGLYKMRLDGTEKTKISDIDYFGFMNVAGEWIYYRDDAVLYRISTDGIHIQRVD
jgi:hypothetical protein